MGIDKTTSIEELDNLYKKAEAELNNALMRGASWQEVVGMRKNVTQLAIEIHKRKYPVSGTPADYNFRD